ncbi:MAG TPA: ABC transporter ATP-binding protein [Tianweitania sediminis]|jgi:NitT/TauT family transport system ATP-binding protein|nr:ABC transporter ATP-binding protein [Tianweitania sediminis]
MSTIQFRNVGRMFNSFVAIDKVDLDVQDKEFLAVVGPSGCGKTTLMRMVAGLEFPSSGEVSVDGKAVRGPGPDRAVVFQQFALLPWKSVRQNIGFGLTCRGTPAAELREQVDHYIALMGLRGHEEAYPHQLSGGMQQRVAIARSYAIDPKVLLMDEPFGALDAQTRTIMQEELVKLARVNPRTVMFITHAVEEAVYLADRIVVMGRNPGGIKEIVDVSAQRKSENWDERPIDEVMDLESFTHLRTRVWRLLRSQIGVE